MSPRLRPRVDNTQSDIVAALRGVGASVQSPTMPCERCGVMFTVKPCRAAARRYCSMACRVAALRDQIPVCICRQCGSEYHRPPSRAGRAGFCSPACKLAASPRRFGVCPQCGAAFSACEPQTYCSVACRVAANHREKVCPTCKRAFKVKPSHIDKKTYCSKDCMTVDYQVRFAGMGYSKVDTNHHEIVAALEKAGAAVLSLADVKGGVPDLLVWHGAYYLLEIKHGRGKLTPAQVKWHATWQAPVAIVRSVEDALEAIGLREPGKDA